MSGFHRLMRARLSDAAMVWEPFTEERYLEALSAGLDAGAIDLHVRMVCPCRVCLSEPRRCHSHVARRSPNGKVWHNMFIVPTPAGPQRLGGKLPNGMARRTLSRHAAQLFDLIGLEPEHASRGARLELGTLREQDPTERAHETIHESETRQ